MPLQATSGAASYDAFGGGAPAAGPQYIEDVFSTYLYTGTGADLTITNGIDLSTKGGLVLLKSRSSAIGNRFYDTARGVTQALTSTLTNGQFVESTSVTSFNSNGFTMGSESAINGSGTTFASWTFREQPKFFDIVTYSGTGSNTTIAHSLGSVPACIFVKRTDTTGDWQVYHRSLANTEYLVLNSTAAKATGATRWNSTTPTSTVFSLGTDATVNASGGTYVAYIFAHNAGGFGLTGTDNVISCGSYTGNGSFSAGPIIDLGYEPQFVLVKNASGIRNWFLLDTTRGLTTDGNMNFLLANTTAAEASAGSFLAPTSTGFQLKTNSADMNANGNIYIYIAIRRGPMKVPTSGTSVFSPIAASSGTRTTGFPVDMQILSYRDGVDALTNHQVIDRLRGVSSTSTEQGNYLNTSSSNAESSASPNSSVLMSNVGFQVASSYAGNRGVFHSFGRAPSFFDVVCYKGTGANLNVTHNLTVIPELIIVKDRSATADWRVYNAAGGSLNSLYLNATPAYDDDSTVWNNTSPTASVFTVGTNSNVNVSGNNYVAYLFATVAGVSKIGSYTGTGTTKQIDCGFTAGARFVLIKRTDVSGAWYVWDTARGIIAGNDPYLLLNTTAAEVTSTDYIDTYSAGFEISSTAPAAINANGGSFIFLAIS
jgi:hypothetical protein